MAETKNNILDFTRMAGQNRFIHEVRQWFAENRQTPPLAYLHSYGCQQNVADGEKLGGLLAQMGYGFTDLIEEADLILYNTCAIREHAEARVFGNVGALKHNKKRSPDLIVVLAGCMTEQPQVAARFGKSYPHVDIVLGTNSWTSLPGLLYERLTGGKRYIHDNQEPESTEIVEGLPVRREGAHKAWVSVMYGCDNFCSYCIVPYVRGRERSRRPEDILKEIAGLVEEGYKEITLLGQNVNSYGKGLEGGQSFAGLLRRINDIPGDFWVRFMTSHPKDCTRELIDAMADCEKVCGHLHLPVQSGSNRILAGMNRRYTVEGYLEILDYARSRMPDLSVTSDIIVGFPGETYEDFLLTLELVRRVKYDALYTFIYSKRSGTKAQSLPDPVLPAEKSRWFRELLAAQDEVGQGRLEGQVGKILKILPDGPGKQGEGTLSARTENNFLVELSGPPALAGQFAKARITGANRSSLVGELI